MSNEHISRRTILRGVGAGVAGTTLAGQVSANRGDSDGYVVGVDPDHGLDVAFEAADSISRELDFGSVGRAVSGQFSESALEALENNPHVRYVEKNARMFALEQTTPYGIEQVEADLAIDDGQTGDGVSVAIVDSGIESNHEDLEANLGEGFAATNAACTESCGGWPPGGGNDNDCIEDWDDDNDHGTHVAGTVGAVDNDEGVVGVAPDVTLHAVKVLDCSGSGSYDDIAAGIEWAADQGHDVINMSLGGDDSAVVKDAVEYADSQGTIIVAAAGNDGPCTDCVGYPAAYDEVIAVSATDGNDDLADFSSTGAEVDIAAPGVDTLSTIPVSAYGEFSGTSMASPHVAGAAALLVGDGYDADGARQQLLDSADDVGLDENEQGAGRLNVADALELDGGGGDGESVSVTTGEATDVGETSATLAGDLTELEGADGATVFFEYGPDGDLSNQTAAQSLSSTGGFDHEITDLEADTEYAFRAVAETDEADDTGSVVTFTTDGDDGGDESSPVIDEFSVSTRSSGPWSRATVDWSVSDADGDLGTVTTELLDADGGVLDSDSSNVGGSSAGGEHEVRTRDSADSVRLTVTDEAGNDTAETRSY